MFLFDRWVYFCTLENSFPISSTSHILETLIEKSFSKSRCTLRKYKLKKVCSNKFSQAWTDAWHFIWFRYWCEAKLVLLIIFRGYISPDFITLDIVSSGRVCLRFSHVSFNFTAIHFNFVATFINCFFHVKILIKQVEVSEISLET